MMLFIWEHTTTKSLHTLMSKQMSSFLEIPLVSVDHTDGSLTRNIPTQEGFYQEKNAFSTFLQESYETS